MGRPRALLPPLDVRHYSATNLWPRLVPPRIYEQWATKASPHPSSAGCNWVSGTSAGPEWAIGRGADTARAGSRRRHRPRAVPIERRSVSRRDRAKKPHRGRRGFRSFARSRGVRGAGGRRGCQRSKDALEASAPGDRQSPNPQPSRLYPSSPCRLKSRPSVSCWTLTRTPNNASQIFRIISVPTTASVHEIATAIS